MGQQIMAAQDGGNILTQQGGQVFLETLGKIVVAPGEAAVIRQAIFAQCVEKGQVPLLVDVGPQPAAEISNFLVAQPLQICHGQVHPFVVVHTDIATGGVGWDMVVQKDCRGAAGVELVQPGVGQGQPQKKCPDIIVLEHVFVVGNGFLYHLVQIDDVHDETGGFRCPPETGHNVVAEIGGFGIGHVLDEKAELLCPLFVQGTGVAQIHGGFQNCFSQCFAHVGRTVQSLGNGALGDVQLVCNVLDSGHKSLLFRSIPEMYGEITFIIPSAAEKINS